MNKLRLLALLIVIPFVARGQSAPGYYRFPTIHGETVVFTAEGDLWKVGAQGGVAQRITTHLGVESNPAISPDGTLLAFSAQYEGPTEVYVMPLQGGLPTRLTFEGEAAIVVGWTPDGKVLYSTRRYSTLPATQLATVDPKTLEQKLLPLSQASDGVFNPGGSTIFFTRLPFQGSQTKRYKGGTAQNIWRYTDGESESMPLTSSYAGTSKNPMWWEGRVYFASDRDGTMNIWSMNEDGGDLKQVTKHQDFDVKTPALDHGKIVYQNGADVWLLDLATGDNHVIPITLSSDFDQTREKWVKEPMEYLTAVHLSPSGDRVVLAARGRIFVAPAEQGRIVEATRKGGVNYRQGRFTPDGRSIIMLSDETGEMEFWRMQANGAGDQQQLTRDGKVFRYDGVASPDGKWLAYNDKDLQLWLLEVEKKTSRRIAVSEQDVISDLSWSPDSRWLAYVDGADNMTAQIKIYSLADGTTTTLTSDRVDSYNPSWSPDGKWLYFLSDRFFKSLVPSPWGSRQPEPFFDTTTKLYVLSLIKGARSPFQPSDELQSSKPEEKPKEGAKGDTSKAPEVRIDFKGIQTRAVEVSIPPGNYSGLSVNKKYLFLVDRERSLDPKRKLMAVEIKNKDVKPSVMVEELRDYELSLDGKKMLVQKKEGIYVIDAAGEAPKDLGKSQVNLGRWVFSVVPREEWRQMFVEAWRLERDYFYDRNLHGVDWPGLLKRHLPLVDRVADRDELDDLIAQLVGELSALHTFVSGGDKRRGLDRVAQGSLGASLVRDEKGGGYRIHHIFRGERDYLDRQSPLVRPDLEIRDGNILEAIDNVPVLSVPHPAVLLKNKVGQQVLLRVKSMTSGKTIDAVVNPISSETERTLRYDDWEYTRRLAVEKAGKGEIGYVHLRAMGGDNYSEWVRNFYPVFNRQGLIIDVRNNSGGNIDSWVLEKLLRRAWFYWQPRVGKPSWNMQYAFRGHVVVLCNEFTMSDGEAFTEGFRRLGLGKVIGTRTWGGEIWLSFDNYLVDKGIASAAETGVMGPEGEWLIEGRGVEPDTVVDNLPRATFQGSDAQLDAAVNYLQEQIRTHPVPAPPKPCYPDKSLKLR